MRWLLPEISDRDSQSKLSAELGIHPLLATVLFNRGYRTPDAASTLLDDKLGNLPNPFSMKGMTAAVDRLVRAINAREKITLYGDYDVDGVCSTALLSIFLELVGGDVASYIPHRLEEGYGLNVPAVEKIARDGTRVLVTLDCGITSVSEIQRARASGLEVIVVDHHSVPAALPEALAILNPHQPGCGYPTKNLCAAGVAFNLCLALRKELRSLGAFANRGEPNLKALLDMVALATVADVVPLTGVNRILVSHGLREIGRASRPGVRALKEVCGLLPESEVSAGQVGFRLAPRINAAGRLDDASLGLRLLRSNSLEEARHLAQALNSANGERQAIERAIFEEAALQAAARGSVKGLVLYSEAWHAGVIGIVASRIVEKFCRPTIMVALKNGSGRGSGRSIEGFHLVEALHACSESLTQFGGHRHAAGLSLNSNRIADFQRSFESVASEKLNDDDLVRRCRIDAVVPPSALTLDAVASLSALGPFGQGNPEPVFAACNVTATSRVVASKLPGRASHLKLTVDGEHPLDAIGFGMADLLASAGGRLDLAFHADLNEWNGRQRVSLKLKALRSSHTA